MSLAPGGMALGVWLSWISFSFPAWSLGLRVWFYLSEAGSFIPPSSLLSLSWNKCSPSKASSVSLSCTYCVLCAARGEGSIGVTCPYCMASVPLLRSAPQSARLRALVDLFGEPPVGFVERERTWRTNFPQLLQPPRVSQCQQLLAGVWLHLL